MTLVAATAQEVLDARTSAGIAPAWRFQFNVLRQPATATPEEPLTLILSKAGYAVVIQDGKSMVIDYALERSFDLDSAERRFSSSSLSTVPYFLAAEWDSRARLSRFIEDVGGDGAPLTMTNSFWRSHDLGLRVPRQEPAELNFSEDGDELKLIYGDEEVIALAPGQEDLPPTVASRLWDVLQIVHPVHPDFVKRAKADKLVPGQLSYIKGSPGASRQVMLELVSQSQVEQHYPLTPGYSVMMPSTAHNPKAADLVAIAWDAAKGSFAPGKPDTSYWVRRLEEAEKDSRTLEALLTAVAMSMYTGTQSPGCDGAADLDPRALCALVRSASDKNRFEIEVAAFMALVGAQDKATKLKAIELLPSYRQEAGTMSPLIDLFIANHISDLTRTVTSGGPGLPDRHEAVAPYSAALKAFPFIRMIYGDIADYYFRYFDMAMGFYFADVGRSLPVPSAVPAGSNLDSVSTIEKKLRADFPTYF